MVGSQFHNKSTVLTYAPRRKKMAHWIAFHLIRETESRLSFFEGVPMPLRWITIGILAIGVCFLACERSAQADDTQLVGKEVIFKTNQGQITVTNPDGTSKLIRRSSIFQKVLAEKDGRLQIDNGGTPGWVDKNDIVEISAAPAYISERIRKNPKDDSAYGFRGMLWYHLGELDNSIDDYTEAIRIAPSASWYTNRGLAYDAKNRYDKAIADFTDAIRLDPNDIYAFNDRGLTHFKKKNFDAAIADYDAVIQLNPSHWGAFNSRGLAHARKKEFDQALADYTVAIRLNPKYPLTYSNRGVIYASRKDYDRAIADFTEAIRLDPKYSGSYNNRGIAYRYKKEYDRAIADYNEAIQLDSKGAGAYLNRGWAYHDKKDYERAIADTEETLRIDPNSDLACNNLAWLLATSPKDALRDGKRAVELATKACEATNWKNLDWIDTLAAACAENKQFDEAVKWQKQTLEDSVWEKENGKEARERLKLYERGQAYREKN
jgi:tetratricopeptide (TPR) repeat protein